MSSNENLNEKRNEEVEINIMMESKVKNDHINNKNIQSNKPTEKETVKENEKGKNLIKRKSSSESFLVRVSSKDSLNQNRSEELEINISIGSKVDNDDENNRNIKKTKSIQNLAMRENEGKKLMKRKSSSESFLVNESSKRSLTENEDKNVKKSVRMGSKVGLNNEKNKSINKNKPAEKSTLKDNEKGQNLIKGKSSSDSFLLRVSSKESLNENGNEELEINISMGSKVDYDHENNKNIPQAKTIKKSDIEKKDKGLNLMKNKSSSESFLVKVSSKESINEKRNNDVRRSERMGSKVSQDNKQNKNIQTNKPREKSTIREKEKEQKLITKKSSSEGFLVKVSSKESLNEKRNDDGIKRSERMGSKVSQDSKKIKNIQTNKPVEKSSIKENKKGQRLLKNKSSSESCLVKLSSKESLNEKRNEVTKRSEIMGSKSVQDNKQNKNIQMTRPTEKSKITEKEKDQKLLTKKSSSETVQVKMSSKENDKRNNDLEINIMMESKIDNDFENNENVQKTKSPKKINMGDNKKDQKVINKKSSSETLLVRMTSKQSDKKNNDLEINVMMESKIGNDYENNKTIQSTKPTAILPLKENRKGQKLMKNKSSSESCLVKVSSKESLNEKRNDDAKRKERVGSKVSQDNKLNKNIQITRPMEKSNIRENEKEPKLLTKKSSSETMQVKMSSKENDKRNNDLEINIMMESKIDNDYENNENVQKPKPTQAFPTTENEKGKSLINKKSSSEILLVRMTSKDSKKEDGNKDMEISLMMGKTIDYKTEVNALDAPLNKNIENANISSEKKVLKDESKYNTVNINYAKIISTELIDESKGLQKMKDDESLNIKGDDKGRKSQVKETKVEIEKRYFNESKTPKEINVNEKIKKNKEESFTVELVPIECALTIDDGFNKKTITKEFEDISNMSVKVVDNTGKRSIQASTKRINKKYVPESRKFVDELNVDEEKKNNKVKRNIDNDSSISQDKRQKNQNATLKIEENKKETFIENMENKKENLIAEKMLNVGINIAMSFNIVKGESASQSVEIDKSKYTVKNPKEQQIITERVENVEENNIFERQYVQNESALERIEIEKFDVIDDEYERKNVRSNVEEMVKVVGEERTFFEPYEVNEEVAVINIQVTHNESFTDEFDKNKHNYILQETEYKKEEQTFEISVKMQEQCALITIHETKNESFTDDFGKNAKQKESIQDIQKESSKKSMKKLEEVKDVDNVKRISKERIIEIQGDKHIYVKSNSYQEVTTEHSPIISMQQSKDKSDSEAISLKSTSSLAIELNVNIHVDVNVTNNDKDGIGRTVSFNEKVCSPITAQTLNVLPKKTVESNRLSHLGSQNVRNEVNNLGNVKVEANPTSVNGTNNDKDDIGRMVSLNKKVCSSNTAQTLNVLPKKTVESNLPSHLGSQNVRNEVKDLGNVKAEENQTSVNVTNNDKDDIGRSVSFNKKVCSPITAQTLNVLPKKTVESNLPSDLGSQNVRNEVNDLGNVKAEENPTSVNVIVDVTQKENDGIIIDSNMDDIQNNFEKSLELPVSVIRSAENVDFHANLFMDEDIGKENNLYESNPKNVIFENEIVPTEKIEIENEEKKKDLDSQNVRNGSIKVVEDPKSINVIVSVSQKENDDSDVDNIPSKLLELPKQDILKEKLSDPTLISLDDKKLKTLKNKISLKNIEHKRKRDHGTDASDLIITSSTKSDKSPEILKSDGKTFQFDETMQKSEKLINSSQIFESEINNIKEETMQFKSINEGITIDETKRKSVHGQGYEHERNPKSVNCSKVQMVVADSNEQLKLKISKELNSMTCLTNSIGNQNELKEKDKETGQLRTLAKLKKVNDVDVVVQQLSKYLVVDLLCEIDNEFAYPEIKLVESDSESSLTLFSLNLEVPFESNNNPNNCEGKKTFVIENRSTSVDSISSYISSLTEVDGETISKSSYACMVSKNADSFDSTSMDNLQSFVSGNKTYCNSQPSHYTKEFSPLIESSSLETLTSNKTLRFTTVSNLDFNILLPFPLSFSIDALTEVANLKVCQHPIYNVFQNNIIIRTGEILKCKNDIKCNELKGIKNVTISSLEFETIQNQFLNTFFVIRMTPVTSFIERYFCHCKCLKIERTVSEKNQIKNNVNVTYKKSFYLNKNNTYSSDTIGELSIDELNNESLLQGNEKSPPLIFEKETDIYGRFSSHNLSNDDTSVISERSLRKITRRIPDKCQSEIVEPDNSLQRIMRWITRSRKLPEK